MSRASSHQPRPPQRPRSRARSTGARAPGAWPCRLCCRRLGQSAPTPKPYVISRSCEQRHVRVLAQGLVLRPATGCRRCIRRRGRRHLALRGAAKSAAAAAVSARVLPRERVSAQMRLGAGGGGAVRTRRQDGSGSGSSPSSCPSSSTSVPALPYTGRPLVRVFAGVSASGGGDGGNDACSSPAGRALCLTARAVSMPPAEPAAAGPIDGAGTDAGRKGAPALKALRRKPGKLADSAATGAAVRVASNLVRPRAAAALYTDDRRELW